jgi:hypothetical protein
MNAERRSHVSDALLIACVGFLNAELFKRFESFVEHYVAVEHVFNDSFEAGAYLHLSMYPYKTKIKRNVG